MRSVRSFSRLSAAVVALGLVAGACGGSDTAEPAAGAATNAAAETNENNETSATDGAALTASISTVTSETFDIATYTGEDTLFWFWAPW